jgi:hypothetical protein
MLLQVDSKICGMHKKLNYTVFKVKVSIWKSIGMGVTEVPLPPSILAGIKKDIPDDLHALKYVVFDVSGNRDVPGAKEQLEQILSIVDTAKQYSLNQIEFRSACKTFLGPIPFGEPTGKTSPALFNRARKRPPTTCATQLPAPKPGLILYRRDSRRRGSCSVISVAEGFASVKWHHNKKVTKIAVANLRSPRLYSTKKICF